MVSVKLLKPYYIKLNSKYIRIILAFQYFSLLIDKKVYHFVPIEGQEILVNRKTKQIVNTDTKLAFQKGKDITYFTIGKLTSLSDFMDQIEEIIRPYEEKTPLDPKKRKQINKQTEQVIMDLERENIKRLIDQALDDKDEATFESLVKWL
ncbi:MAG TPA: IDEAL domain-containing protein [Pseudogracilibacillus sp.]|nr:IDEAL domain-containing protein [Pseudogracilibacillus sp.]